jgi:hypothetical protein
MNNSKNAAQGDSPHIMLLIVHARIFTVTDGWNLMHDESEIFQFGKHGFNFDYLLHLSGINYLVHPEDIQQIINFVKEAKNNRLDYRFRFINRAGEIRSVQGSSRLVAVQQG